MKTSSSEVGSWTARKPKILKCDCVHSFQDMKYGVKFRVHTPIKDKIGNNWRCTICGMERP